MRGSSPRRNGAHTDEIGCSRSAACQPTPLPGRTRPLRFGVNNPRRATRSGGGSATTAVRGDRYYHAIAQSAAALAPSSRDVTRWVVPMQRTHSAGSVALPLFVHRGSPTDARGHPIVPRRKDRRRSGAFGVRWPVCTGGRVVPGGGRCPHACVTVGGSSVSRASWRLSASNWPVVDHSCPVSSKWPSVIVDVWKRPRMGPGTGVVARR
jgi:hypothetical protein